MAKKWYPVIDILSCVECGTCVNFCSHGVFDKEKSPFPVVVNPAACMDHCHGCGNKCPEGAITYVGDDTGWIPPARKGEAETTSECACGCSRKREDRVGKELRLLRLWMLLWGSLSVKVVCVKNQSFDNSFRYGLGKYL